jgi:alpha-ketoglutarate-dependent taurine dioxygenase
MPEPRLQDLPLRAESLGPGPGLVLTNVNGRLADLPVPVFKELYRQCGVLAFRGFDANKTAFMNFARLFMKRIRTTPELLRRKDKLHPGLQTALIGTDGLNFHADFAQVPDRTHVICFYCAVPSRTGGDTLVTDGELLYRALSPVTQELLRTRRIRHSTTLNRANWSAFSNTQDPQTVISRSAEVPDLLCIYNDTDDSITTLWTTCAVTPSIFGKDPCLCTNIFPGVYNGLVTTWEDGEPLSPQLLGELGQKARDLSQRLTWNRAGDFAIVDNTRCVHARTPFDGVRQLFTLQGYV